MKKELAKNFDPAVSEKKIYQFWLDNNFFHAEVDSQEFQMRCARGIADGIINYVNEL